MQEPIYIDVFMDTEMHSEYTVPNPMPHELKAAHITLRPSKQTLPVPLK